MAEPPRRHICTVCGKTETWGPTWQWYGSDLLAEEDSAAIEKVCSEACKKKYKPSEAIKKASRRVIAKAKSMSYVDEDDRWGR